MPEPGPRYPFLVCFGLWKETGFGAGDVGARGVVTGHEGVAVTGQGVFETLKEVAKLVLAELKKSG